MNTIKCNEWAKDRLSPTPKNPLTNRKIKIGGPKYKELDKECEKFLIDINDVCQKWLEDNHKDLYLKLQTKQVKGKKSPKDDKKQVKDKKSPKDDKKQVKDKKSPKDDKKQVKDKKLPLIETSSSSSIPYYNALDEPSDSISDEDGSSFYYSIYERQKFNDIIKDYLKKIIIADGKACMTQSKTLLKYVKNIQLLGVGSFGNVYQVLIPNTDITIAVKEGRISAGDLKKAFLKQYPLEYLYNKLINDLIDDKICPNFSYTYTIFFCDKCTLYEFTKNPIQTQCSETVVELFNFTLNKLTDLRDEVILSILFQILYALSCIQIKYGMYHNDVKQENILIKRISPGGYWEYYIENDLYKVPNYGYLVALNDFGISSSFKPGVSTKDYGRRQAEVVKINNKYKFRPFTTKQYPLVSKNGAISSIKPPKLGGYLNLTWNHFYKNFDSEPSISVDLEDMGRFPIFFFHYDILDAIRSFIGGKRNLQPGHHIPLKVSDKIKTLLKDFYVVKAQQVWPEDRVDLFLAHHTIAKLFSFYLQSTLKGPKIEEYHLSL